MTSLGKHKKKYYIVCAYCGKQKKMASKLARYCSDSHRELAYFDRKAKAEKIAPASKPSTPSKSTAAPASAASAQRPASPAPSNASASASNEAYARQYGFTLAPSAPIITRTPSAGRVDPSFDSDQFISELDNASAPSVPTMPTAASKPSTPAQTAAPARAASELPSTPSAKSFPTQRQRQLGRVMPFNGRFVMMYPELKNGEIFTDDSKCQYWRAPNGDRYKFDLISQKQGIRVDDNGKEFSILKRIMGKQ